MTSTLLIIQFILAIIITITILLQKSSSIGLGAYSGSNESLFGAKGPASFLSKATIILGFLFVINTITLGYIYNQQKMKSAVDNVKIQTLIPAIPKKATSAPEAPSIVPETPTVPKKDN